jgi:ribosomal protein S18 acetylase RimI-like enzyme
MLFTKLAETEIELQQILKLQQLYLSGNKDGEEEKEQGFVTVHHSLEKLKQLHALAPSVIVKDDERVIAYALVMLKSAAELIPELKSMFEMLKALSFNGKPLDEYSYYVMGQVCVDKPYRGLGVFQKLYDKHKELMRPSYDFVLTEIATRNTRSIRAHEKAGFQLLLRFKDEREEWDIVLWDWS